MPYDPSPVEEIQVAPLANLAPDGPWQTELAHDRKQSLLIWITRGQGLAMLDGTRGGFGAHSVLYIPARSLMSVELGRGTLGQVLMVPPESPLSLPRRAHHLRIGQAQDQAALTGLFESLGREQAQQDTLWLRAMQPYGELAGIWLRRQIHAAEINAGRQSAARRLSLAYSHRVVEHFTSGTSMAEHAAALQVTPTHLTRVCKSETGKTAANLLTERQLHAARSLLINSSLPMRDIADQLGFGSAAYFTRFIAQHVGQTPSALRKAARK
jgi:AraC family transcriptional activator of pobA